MVRGPRQKDERCAWSTASQVQVLGQMMPVLSKGGMLVTPVIGYVSCGPSRGEARHIVTARQTSVFWFQQTSRIFNYPRLKLQHCLQIYSLFESANILQALLEFHS